MEHWEEVVHGPDVLVLVGIDVDHAVDSLEGGLDDVELVDGAEGGADILQAVDGLQERSRLSFQSAAIRKVIKRMDM